MLKAIEGIIQEFREASKSSVIRIISHYDSDGITAASILSKALQREDKNFSVTIVKQLESSFIEGLKEIVKNPKEMLIFLDLGSSALEQLSKLPAEIFVFDHHEINSSEESQNAKNIHFINPHSFNEEVSAAGLVYLFAKALNPANKDLAGLAIIGMVGDMLEQSISKMNNHIMKDAADLTVKQGLLIFSAARPLNKALELSSDIFIPGVSGSASGTIDLLREIGIKISNGRYPSMLEISKEELSRLITTIMLRRLHIDKEKEKNIIGNIYLLKFFGKVEDIRELSALINACGRLGYPDIALAFCLGSRDAKNRAEEIYAKYKHDLIKALRWVENNKHIMGKGYMIINAKDSISDSIIGTTLSIISSSFIYDEGTIIVGLAYQQGGKIKVSARIAGRSKDGVNLHKLMGKVAGTVGGEAGGHSRAAGCIIPVSKETEFIEELEKEAEAEQIKIRV
ncbi:MAG: DHH family phosphoesterase [archaeon]